ncbi:MAG: patatin-like phospholipase family protein [Myxococcales bacterium]
MAWRAERAIVLGGGGVTGIAWEIGYLAGLADAGVDVTRAELLVGTSAGATAAVQITSGYPLEDVWRRQLEIRVTPRPAPTFDFDEFVETMRRLGQDPDASALRRELGQQASNAPIALSAPERRAMMARRLLAHAWPSTELALVAVDADSGKPHVFSNDSGVPLIDAVTASSALPGIYPPAQIGDHHYMDGALRSMENADMAAGCARVLVLQALALPGVDTLETQVRTLRDAQARVHIAQPDADSLAAMGLEMLDPAACAATARAGHAQGHREASELAELWN